MEQFSIVKMERISVENMKAILKEFAYVFGRSGVRVRIVSSITFVNPTESQWGSRTNIELTIHQTLQRNHAEDTCSIALYITGATTLHRMEKIGLGELVSADLGNDEMFIVDVEADGFPISDLPYSLTDLRVIGDLQRHEVAEYPGMTLEIPGKYLIESGVHSCESCGKDCFYTDFDGVIKYADGLEAKFHVTCSGNIQLQTILVAPKRQS